MALFHQIRPLDKRQLDKPAPLDKPPTSNPEAVKKSRGKSSRYRDYMRDYMRKRRKAKKEQK